MKMTAVNEVQFASLNNKRYYYLDGITSLPNGHPKTQKLIKEEKTNFLKEELNALRKYEKINTFRTILL